MTTGPRPVFQLPWDLGARLAAPSRPCCGPFYRITRSRSWLGQADEETSGS
jgi:hypothetical protein